jgi:hypothetical protein
MVLWGMGKVKLCGQGVSMPDAALFGGVTAWAGPVDVTTLGVFPNDGLDDSTPQPP